MLLHWSRSCDAPLAALSDHDNKEHYEHVERWRRSTFCGDEGAGRADRSPMARGPWSSAGPVRSQVARQGFGRSRVEVGDPQGGTAGTGGDFSEEGGQPDAPLEGAARHLARLEPAPGRYGRLASQAAVTHDQPVLLESPAGILVREPSVQG